MQNSRARIPPPQRDCGGWDALVRARAARVPAPPTLPRLCPEEEASSHAPPHAAPLKKGGDALAPRPLPAVLYTAATRRCAMLCKDMLCYAMRSRAVLCYAIL